MLLVDDLAAGGTKNLRHTPSGLVTLWNICPKILRLQTYSSQKSPFSPPLIFMGPTTLQFLST